MPATANERRRNYACHTHCRRRNFRHKSKSTKGLRRALQLENLEPRTLLSGDGFWPGLLEPYDQIAPAIVPAVATIGSSSWATDPPGDAAEPNDLKRIDARVEASQLVLRVSYYHSIQPRDLSDISLGTINLDLDGDILTGFTSAGSGPNTWPTFGVDATLQYRLYPWALGGNIELVLTTADPSTGDVQVFDLSPPWSARSQDVRCVAQGNWVELSVPLSLLPPVTDEAAVLVDAYTIFGGWDTVPDGGGLEIAKHAVKPFLSGGSLVASLTDPAGDSDGFGRDNDDLVGVRAYEYGEGILLEIAYANLDPVAQGITQIAFDVDQDPTTGERVRDQWGRVLMGAETSIDFIWDLGDGTIESSFEGGLTAVQVHGTAGDLIRGAETLMGGNFATRSWRVTVPYQALGVRSGAGLDVFVRTMSSYLVSLPYDELNQGAISVGGQTRNHAPDSYPTRETILTAELPDSATTVPDGPNNVASDLDAIIRDIDALLGGLGSDPEAPGSPSLYTAPDPWFDAWLDDLLADSLIW